MAKLSASKAAKAAGVSLPTISRAIKSGKMSADKVEGGGFLVDTSELFRVFPPVTDKGNDTPFMLGSETPNESGVLRLEVEMLRERLTDKDGVIDDLRRRLDAEAEERRKLTLILTDQSGRPPPPATQERPKRSWWPWAKAND